MVKRAIAVAMLITVVLGLFIVRLAWLQLFPWSHHASTAAVKSSTRMSVAQRQRSLTLDTGRGDFVDRYGRAITGETYDSVALFPIHPEARGTERDLAELAKLLKVPESELLAKWNGMESPDYWRSEKKEQPYRLSEEQKRRLASLHLNGVRVLPYRSRALHLFQAIGFTSQHPEWLKSAYPNELASGKRKLTDQVGGIGLEKSLDKLLRGIGETKASYFVDGKYKPLSGLDMRITGPENAYYPLQAVTTIDLELQERLEAYADAQGLKEGAIVVLDAHNADIVAMVSRPAMSRRFAAGGENGQINHALVAVPPGSVFKLVTEAAALEAGVAAENEIFTCNGEYGRYGLSCWKEGGHGRLTLREGLAQSCNVAFATIAERLRPEQLERTAAALGVGKQVGWYAAKPFGPFREPLRLLGEEEAGRLFYIDGSASTAESKTNKVNKANKTNKANEPREVEEAVEAAEAAASVAAAQARKQIDGGVMAQSGIGQRDVLMTPLQAANLTVTLLNHGRVMEPRLVSEIRYANGGRLSELHEKRLAGNRIQPATARKLLRGMEAVVDHGTGRSIREGIWQVAGKSGTADVKRNGTPRIHQWFTGYGPAQSPQYATAVLAKYRPSGSANQATALFRGVMDILAEHEIRRLADTDKR
ncbi:peptidoglycan D,D-transpeptidase FtsI family protein [Paenibacillus sp. NPDC058071]|uniref:peptidoglycan D,D-transpeptidase FtsI family protein n=1 Tax=Paenibacillus sp. NPDC058071 TaxID=3346326 RepID=UPI0036DC3DA7